jgi:hypothetical protein
METRRSQVGARICNGLGIMRACLETQKLEQLEARMDEIADRVARDRTNAAGRAFVSTSTWTATARPCFKCGDLLCPEPETYHNAAGSGAS